MNKFNNENDAQHGTTGPYLRDGRQLMKKQGGRKEGNGRRSVFSKQPSMRTDATRMNGSVIGLILIHLCQIFCV